MKNFCFALSISRYTGGYIVNSFKYISDLTRFPGYLQDDVADSRYEFIDCMAIAVTVRDDYSSNTWFSEYSLRVKSMLYKYLGNPSSEDLFSIVFNVRRESAIIKDIKLIKYFDRERKKTKSDTSLSSK